MVVGANTSYTFSSEAAFSSSAGIASAISFPSGEKHTLHPLP